MTHTEALIDFIMNLTEEEAERIIRRLPEVTAALGEQAPPSLPKQNLPEQ